MNIPLTNSKGFATVDEESLALVSGFTWHKDANGYIRSNQYPNIEMGTLVVIDAALHGRMFLAPNGRINIGKDTGKKPGKWDKQVLAETDQILLHEVKSYINGRAGAKSNDPGETMTEAQMREKCEIATKAVFKAANNFMIAVAQGGSRTNITALSAATDEHGSVCRRFVTTYGPDRPMFPSPRDIVLAELEQRDDMDIFRMVSAELLNAIDSTFCYAGSAYVAAMRQPNQGVRDASFQTLALASLAVSEAEDMLDLDDLPAQEVAA